MSIFLFTQNYAVFFYSKVFFPNKMFALVINSFSTKWLPGLSAYPVMPLVAVVIFYSFWLSNPKKSTKSVQMFTRHRAGWWFSGSCVKVTVAHCIKLEHSSTYMYEIVLAFMFWYGTASILHLYLMSSLKGQGKAEPCSIRCGNSGLLYH